MTIVSDSGPLITLARIKHFALLRELFGHIYIPQAVYEEITVAGEGLPGSQEVQDAVGTWMEIRPVQEPLLARGMFTLGRGEAEAIALALEIKADVILLDDKRARRAAKFMGLSLSGTIGVLRLALEEGRIEDWEKVLKELKTRGFWISEEVIH
jgi:predicted nucleic acid-binding protein